MKEDWIMNEIIERFIDVATLNESPLYLTDCDLIEEDTNDYVSEALTDYIKGCVNEQKDNDVVRIMAAAMQIASESGMLETPATSTLQTAIAAVDIAKNLNLSYLLEQGEILAEEAADALIDQAAANASVMAEVILQPKVLEIGLNRALDYVSAVWPPVAIPAQLAKQYTSAIASFVSDKIKPIVKRGIPIVAQGVKSLVRSVISKVSATVKSTAQTVGKKILALL